MEPEPMPVKYTLFLPDGTPIRADVSVQTHLPAGHTPRTLAQLATSPGTAAARQTNQTDWEFLQRSIARVPLGGLATSGPGLLFVRVSATPAGERSKLVMWVTNALRGPVTGLGWSIRIVENDGVRPRQWLVPRAYPIKWTGPTLPAQGTDVAMEELVVTHEGIRLD
jgi:hypothetical protein